MPSRRGPKRRGAGAGLSYAGSTRMKAGKNPDPSWIGRHPTHIWIKMSAFLNIIFGILYIGWRATESMPENPKSVIWNWFFFGGEVILLIGVWTSHFQRAMPAIREICNMDDLIEVDFSLDQEALVCIMVPTAGEKLRNIKHVLLGAYSQRLWPSRVPANKQLRVAVLDEKGRSEVVEMCEKVYNLAASLSSPEVQEELCTKLNEPTMSPKIFMDYFNQARGAGWGGLGMDALDKFVFSPKCHPAFDNAIQIDSSGGTPSANRLVRSTSATTAIKRNKGAPPSRKKERLPEGHKVLFDSKPTIPSIIYSARANPGTPKVSPKAGNMNAAIFSTEPGEEPVIGSAARITVVNDARHRLKSDFLQRTVPYFFKLDKSTGKSYDWGNVGFVQVPQRFEDLGDGDPLGNHAVMTFFISNVSKDGVSGVTSCGQGSLWRTDALRGMAANGQATCDPVADPSIIGHACGFRAEVLIEDTHTSLEFFKKQWVSAYVCEAGETLAVCVEQPNTVAWRIKQVFRWHLGAVQLLLKDGLGFICTSRMPTPFHKMFGIDSLTYYIQAVGGMFIIFMPIAFSISQETPFVTRGLGFVYFFLPYIVTATIPTLLAVSWKNVNPNRVLTDEQFWLSTCYVQVWAFALGFYNKIACKSPDNAWNLVCPVWPLAFLFWALGVSAINTSVYWIYLEGDSDNKWIWMASFGACLVVMQGLWPMVKLWWPGWPSLPTAYHTKFIFIIIFITLSSVLATYFS
ncbi:unnamed protein product [Discosporangium mesarthrocarpum]